MNSWNKVKTALFRLLDWFRHKTPEILSAKKVKPAGEARIVDTRQPGPNMPKRQPCPNGHGWKRRDHKTVGGAYYHCNCGNFFVRAGGA